MNTIKQLITIALLVFIAHSSMAQQDPHYTQYMYNMSLMNPAYAGSKETLSTGLLYRKQWVQIEDAPTTATFFGHLPVGKNVGAGLSLSSDKIGPVNETNIYGDVSYTLKLGGEHKLSFGVKTGLTLHKVGLYDDIYNTLPDADDPAFSENTSNTYFNFGSGIFYHTKKYYVAISVPNFLKSKHLDFNGNEYGSEFSHYFATAGYVFDINTSLKLKPFFMVKSAFNAPTSVDISLNALYKEKVEFGATYRFEDSFGAMVNFAITPELRIGYAYDHIVSDLNVTTSASHEFILLYDIKFAKKVSESPRFF
ncbi:MAG: PorP/SprF family type IX secretion system membrane protein [Flavobacteriaceae bacterium]